MIVKDALVKDILEKLPRSQRKQIVDSLTGKNTHKVYCASKHNKFVGYLQNVNGETRFDATELDNGRPIIIAWRPRLDGQIGFQCQCGNDSRIAKEEEGEFDYKGNLPTRAGFERIFEKLKVNPNKYPEKDGITIVDGFRLEKI